MNAAIPYALPFLVFIVLLGTKQLFSVSPWLTFLVTMAVIVSVSRRPLRFRLVQHFGSILVGIAVFFLWVGPDYLFPGYHNFWLFSNGVMGHPTGSTAPAQRSDVLWLTFRILISVVAVPILEELFWRGWLMRWLINPDFERVPLGTYDKKAFWIVAVLFASEHGSFWDVGLVTGIIFNWWMIRTRSLWDCILMHAVTNGILAWYVLRYDQWAYWL